jgi:hypothetical protein
VNARVLNTLAVDEDINAAVFLLQRPIISNYRSGGVYGGR